MRSHLHQKRVRQPDGIHPRRRGDDPGGAAADDRPDLQLRPPGPDRRHGSSSSNNPYESALDVAACGGNPGKPNPRLIAMMANHPEVRQRLRRGGIRHPVRYAFPVGAARHDHRSGELRSGGRPCHHRRDVTRLKENLQQAACGPVKSATPACRADAGDCVKQSWQRVAARSADWSRRGPEWGLSGKRP